MAVGEAKEEPRAGRHAQRVIWPIVAQLVDAIVGEVQRVIGVPVKAHCVAYACRCWNHSHIQRLKSLGPSIQEHSSIPLHATCRKEICGCLLDDSV